MKLYPLVSCILVALFIAGCSQPVAQSLLTSEKENSNLDSEQDTTSIPDNSFLDVQPDNTDVVVNIDNSDRVEITGNCKDLDRRKNQIIVEAFAGEDETVAPYVSNELSDLCVNTSAGLLLTDKCFWSTKGVGMVQDVGLPSERTFPQCHNGRFGFSVRLGKILVNPVPAQPNLKYLIRFKLRTLEGLLADSAFARVRVTRGLDIPIVKAPVFDSGLFRCRIEASPARFNFNILYRLNRTVTDAIQTNALSTDLYVNSDTSVITDGLSVFSFNDLNVFNTHFILPGVDYNYTLNSTESQFNYALTPPTPTAASGVAVCRVPQILLTQTQAPQAGGTCHFGFTVGLNPMWPAGGVSYEWGFSSTDPNWIGPNANTAVAPLPATCNLAGGNAPTCSQNGLAGNQNHFFAVRARSIDGQVGKWSNVSTCRPPP